MDKSLLKIAEEVTEIIKNVNSPCLLLVELRHRENMSQIEFAKNIGTIQANLSSMESGRRSIGRAVAKRIQKKFGIDYRLFL